ncbi:uncharacterized transmembrane protein DDB_G0289901-like [Sycon ciliatum]|uniref:uncharacterized transmembrane protein DDB_G0289901-like n=1 Tax=Sycon ciliatum TaxID=27933 RepID=UPI0031F6036F
MDTASSNGFIGAGSGNLNRGTAAGIVAGDDNDITVAASNSFIGAGTGHRITTATANNVIVGGDSNFVSGGTSGGIVSGVGNRITGGDEGFIGAGDQNLVAADDGFVGAGQNNTVSAAQGGIVAGLNSIITAAGGQSFIGGGQRNLVCDLRGVVGAGQNNQNGATNGVIGGGFGNSIGGGCPGFRRDVAGAQSSGIFVGENNTISTTGGAAAILTGTGNTISGDSQNAAIGGGTTITISATGDNDFVAGGERNSIAGASTNCFIMGGRVNMVTGACEGGGVVGGFNNTISGTAGSVILGGNNITATADNTAYAQDMEVVGDLTLGGGILSTRFTFIDNTGGATSYTPTNDDRWIITDSSATPTDITFTLPDAGLDHGRQICIKDLCTLAGARDYIFSVGAAGFPMFGSNGGFGGTAPVLPPGSFLTGAGGFQVCITFYDGSDGGTAGWILGPGV